MTPTDVAATCSACHGAREWWPIPALRDGSPERDEPAPCPDCCDIPPASADLIRHTHQPPPSEP